ncbi:ATP-binding cassette domain-containing protein [bacterium]|nr:ATP-binding cassette domain-containing protein [bacterium]
MTAAYTTIALLKRIWRDYLKPQWRIMLVAGICMLLEAGSTAANAWLMQPVLDDVFIKKNETLLWIIPGAVFLLAIVKAFATYGQATRLRTVGQRLISNMQKQLYAHLLRADVAMFTRESTGQLLSRLVYDTTLLRESAASIMTVMIKEFVTLIFLLGVMLHQHVTLSLVAMVVFPLAFYPMRRLSKRMRKLSHSMQGGQGELTARFEESFSAVRIIKAHNQEAAEADRIGGLIETMFGQYVKSFRVKGASAPMMEMLAGLAIAGVIFYGGHQVLEGHTTPGAFFSFITALIMAYKPLKSLTGFTTLLQEGLAAAERVFLILDTPPSITDKPAARELQINKGNIAFDRVCFHYADGTAALDNVSLTIPGGKTVALVGTSGAGKSSLANLLMRFYDVSSGAITIDKQDVRDVTLQSLRGNIALVTQENLLFDDTVAANIAYGLPDATPEQIEAAAKAADAHHFISALAQGYATRIGPHGMTLSGGQRQRLAIARAMLKNAPILVLDEATSALDPATEAAVQDALKTLMKGRTTLVIAHRLSTIADADEIMVMKDGKLLEHGTHDMLLKQGGEYARLYKSQGAAR